MMNNQDKEWLLRDKYLGEKTPEFERDLERLENGEPLAFVIGWVPFLNTKIYLDSRPLIPRIETEYGVNEVLNGLEDRELRVLDLCAGSGCIGVAVLKRLPRARVDFVELEEKHHPTILKNIHENKLDESRTQILGGDLFERVTDKYDLILSNPPYIDKELKRVEESVKKYEPEEALYGGKEGLEVIKRILEGAAGHLNPGGVLYIEHEPEQAEFLAKNPLFKETFSDQLGRKRYSSFGLPRG
jgi:release factor glutamine methyltransferase